MATMLTARSSAFRHAVYGFVERDWMFRTRTPVRWRWRSLRLRLHRVAQFAHTFGFMGGDDSIRVVEEDHVLMRDVSMDPHLIRPDHR